LNSNLNNPKTAQNLLLDLIFDARTLRMNNKENTFTPVPKHDLKININSKQFRNNIPATPIAKDGKLLQETLALKQEQEPPVPKFEEDKESLRTILNQNFPLTDLTARNTALNSRPGPTIQEKRQSLFNGPIRVKRKQAMVTPIAVVPQVSQSARKPTAPNRRMTAFTPMPQSQPTGDHISSNGSVHLRNFATPLSRTAEMKKIQESIKQFYISKQDPAINEPSSTPFGPRNLKPPGNISSKNDDSEDAIGNPVRKLTYEDKDASKPSRGIEISNEPLHCYPIEPNSKSRKQRIDSDPSANKKHFISSDKPENKKQSDAVDTVDIKQRIDIGPNNQLDVKSLLLQQRQQLMLQLRKVDEQELKLIQKRQQIMANLQRLDEQHSKLFSLNEVHVV